MTAIPQATAIDGYRWLKNDIICGVYHPDEKLRMSLLTSRYGLGVGPLREALSQLVAERLVTVVNQKGYRVAPMSEQELLDIFDARANMEAMLVRLAIERGGDEWEAELLARAHLLNKLESCEASEHLLDEWDQRHQAFHTAIVAGCGSQYLLQMRERLFDLAARYRFIWLRTTVLSVEMLEDKHVQHQTLVDAILARDAEQASALMREHLLTPIPIIQQAMAGKLSPQAGESDGGVEITGMAARISTPHGRGEIVSVDQSGSQANRLAEIVGRFQLQIKGGQQRCCALVKLAQRFFQPVAHFRVVNVDRLP